MARTSKAKSQAKKDTSPGPLKKSFEARGKKGQSPRKPPKSAATTTSRGAPSSPSDVSRGDTSAFLSYLRSAMKVKSNTTAEQALQLHQHYKSLDMQEKKALICEFFKAGGKRQGLTCLFSQHVESSQVAGDLEWSGYVTAEGLMELFSVSLGLVSLVGWK